MLIDETYYICADDFNDFEEYSRQYISAYISKEEIKKQEREYILETIKYPWYDAIANGGSVYRMVSEGRYYSWPGKTVDCMFFSNKRNSAEFQADEMTKTEFVNRNNVYMLNWKDYLVCSELCAASQIVYKFKLAKWQFGIVEEENGDCQIFILIPDIYFNKMYIVNAMKTFGYFLQRKRIRKDIGEKWVSFEFGMNKQSIINDMLADHQYLYHIAPQKYDHKILKNGLVPRNNNVLYRYPDRVYMFASENILGEEVTDLDASDFKMPTRLLYDEKEKSNNDYVNDNLFSVWKISVRDILGKTNICADLTQETIQIPKVCFFISLYTEDNISPNSIEKLFSVDLTDI